MNSEDYKRDPCGASSLPFWKTNSILLPSSMIIVREDQFVKAPEGYDDVPYFKMIHRFDGLTPGVLPEGFSLISADENDFADHISRCYEQESVSAEELKQYKKRSVFSPCLWIAVKDDRTGEIAATGIAELDNSIKEGVLEWIQVSPEYRRRGLGRFLVKELLLRLQEKAEFVTVSGRVQNDTNALALYRSCGFRAPVIWHVLRMQ